MKNCCQRLGLWQFCPWCGAPWIAPDNRHAALDVQAIARMRRDGMTWKAIGGFYGYGHGQNVRMFVTDAFLDSWRASHPRPEDNQSEEFSKWENAYMEIWNDGLDAWLAAWLTEQISE